MIIILNKKYPNMHFEVLNFGVSGSHSDYWVSRLAELFKFQPDMIIQYNAANDITGLFLSKHNPCANKNKLFLLKALNASFLYQKLFPLNPVSMDNCFRLIFDNISIIHENHWTSFSLPLELYCHLFYSIFFISS